MGRHDCHKVKKRKHKADPETPLQIAASRRRLNNIRQLLYETDCDPNELNEYDKTASFMYFINLLTKASDFRLDQQCLTEDEISCFVELMMYEIF